MKGNRLGLKLWEKNYVFSLALFVAAFYLCLFLIGKGALDQAMENERAAALHIHDLAARSLALDVATLQERQEEDLPAHMALAQALVANYHRLGVDLSVTENGMLLAGAAVRPRIEGRVAVMEREGARYMLRIDGTLPGAEQMRLVYHRDVTQAVREQQRLSVALLAGGAAVAAAVALGLYWALRALYRPMDQLAHELRTSLTAVCGYGEYLQLANASEVERQEAAEFIVQESRRLTDLAERLLLLGNLREGSVRVEQVPVAALFAGAAKAFSRVSYLPTDGEIQGDGALLQSLVNNLVKNALEAGATQVELSFREGCLTVTDNGCGMDEATLAMARTPPRRGSMTGNKGMGLALCHRIAALHRARISFASQVELGTQVQVDFTTS